MSLAIYYTLMEPRTKWEANNDKRNAVERADAAGEVADSDAVRLELIQQMKRGEKTLAQIQAELAQIKRTATKNGKLTKTQVWNRS